jgi:hypothetical protein
LFTFGLSPKGELRRLSNLVGMVRVGIDNLGGP